ncbi:unnamed protein product [Calypogeia fissa]
MENKMEAPQRGSAMEASGEKKMGGKEARKIESLGWITESSVMPRKRRDIEGVGAASILELQAELYRTQEDVKKVKEGGAVDLDEQRSRRKLAVPDVFSRKNSGVEERAGRDKLHLKTENDGSASYTALEKKAELYDKLVRGEVPDGDSEKYNVLFYKKGTLENEFEEMESERKGETSNPNFSSIFQDQNGSAPASLDDPSPIGFVQRTTIGLSQEQKQLIKEVNEETIQERQKASTLKQKREEAAGKKREQLRNAYIKKKLEEMKAASRNSTLVETPGDGAVVADPKPQIESFNAA